MSEEKFINISSDAEVIVEMNEEKFITSPDYNEGFKHGFKAGNKETQLYSHALLTLAIDAVTKIREQLANPNPTKETVE